MTFSAVIVLSSMAKAGSGHGSGLIRMFCSRLPKPRAAREGVSTAVSPPAGRRPDLHTESNLCRYLIAVHRLPLNLATSNYTPYPGRYTTCPCCTAAAALLAGPASHLTLCLLKQQDRAGRGRLYR
ncbi:hypothetical protein J6590_045904 [Homalodisca vitripennis]|nr:hypothetical protein J6590_045904 [Homalodisca vitripennis]